MAETSGTCGKKYRDRAVTVDGYTLDNPYGRFAIYTDYAGWKVLASDLVDEMKLHLDHLGKQEQEPYPLWHSFVEQHNGVIRAYNALPAPSALMTGGTITDSIAKAASVVIDALCLTEQYDDAVASIPGSKPPPPVPGGVKPAPPPKPIDPIGATTTVANNALKLGALALGAYLIINLTKKK